MPLQPEAREGNIERSLTEWIRAKLVTIEGLTVHFSDAPVDTRSDEWVHVDYLLGMRRQFGRTIDGARLGNRAHGIINLNLCKRRQSITNLYALATMRDKVAPYFQTGQTIPLKDYDVGGTPEIGRLLVHETTQGDVDSGLESGVMVRALSVNLSYIEAYTLIA